MAITSVLKNGGKKGKIGKRGIYKKGQNWYINYYVGGREKEKRLVLTGNLLYVLNKRKTQVAENSRKQVF